MLLEKGRTRLRFSIATINKTIGKNAMRNIGLSVSLSVAFWLTSLPASACNASTLQGSYAFQASGWGYATLDKPAAVKIAIAGVISFSPKLNGFSGSAHRAFTFSADGSLVTAPPPSQGLTGKYVVRNNCTGLIKWQPGPPGVPAETYLLYFTGDGKTVYFINATQGIVLSGQMTKQ
jgi:hypothetical protein